MSKKERVGIFIIVIILFLILGGAFLWQESRFPKSKTVYQRTFVDGKNYEIIDTPEGKIVENKKERLIVKVPEDWIVKKYEETVGLFSPGTDFNQYGGFLESIKKKGTCLISITIYKCKKVDPEIATDVDEIRYLINQIQNLTLEKSRETTEEPEIIYEVETVGNKSALRRIFLKKGEEKYISVEVPVDNTVYSFESGIILSEKCIQEFNNFLKTVLINK